jgi:hypothetical protein
MTWPILTVCDYRVRTLAYAADIVHAVVNARRLFVSFNRAVLLPNTISVSVNNALVSIQSLTSLSNAAADYSWCFSLEREFDMPLDDRLVHLLINSACVAVRPYT